MLRNWYNDDFREAKRNKRRLERTGYQTTGLEVHKEAFKQACRDYSKMLESAKTSHYKTTTESSDENQLFKLVEQMFHHNKTTLPKYNGILVPVRTSFGCVGVVVKRTMYQLKVDVDTLNAVKSVLADVARNEALL